MAFHFLTGDAEGVVYAGTPDGSLVYYRDEARDGTPRWSNGGSGQVIGTGWADLDRVFTAGDGVIYAVAPNGDLLFFQDLARNGTSHWANGGAAQRIGVGWNGFRHLVNGDDGVIYAVTPNGDLLYYRDRARDGTADWDAASGSAIGQGWDSFLRALPGGNGVIYAVGQDGGLFWFQDLARDGTMAWANDGAATRIGSGWDIFVEVISAGDGVFYAITPDGFMLYYRDQSRAGDVDWAFNGAGVTVGGGWTAVPTRPATVAGYTPSVSAAPGDTVAFKVSALSPYDVTLQRLKSQPDGSLGIDIASIPRQAGIARPAPATAWSTGCDWPDSFSLTVPAGAKSGVYSARCNDLQGEPTHICFVVTPGAGQRGDIAVLANTNTWISYNDWGGRSKYSAPAGAVLSYARPNPTITPVATGPIDHLLRAELWLLNWLEDEGYLVDVYADSDFHRGIDAFDGYKALVLSTHPEYWTSAMMDNLEAYLAAGGSLVYLGGNGLFEQVEIDDDAQAIVHMGGDPAVNREHFYFRNLAPPRPERATLGVAYRYDGYMTFAPYRVLQGSHRLFSGTGLSTGSEVGAEGINGRGASGWEMDTSLAGTAAPGAIVTAIGNSDRGSPPSNIEVLARGTNPGMGADMTFFETGNGGCVFSAGSISFVGSMIGDSELQQIVRNVLQECGVASV